MQTMGAKRVTWIVIFIQIFVTLLIAAAFLVSSEDYQATRSALIGGSISVLATLYFARQVFSTRIGSPAVRIARSFYVGEIMKFMLTFVLLSLAFQWTDSSPFPLLLAYTMTLMAYWLALPFTFDVSVRTL